MCLRIAVFGDIKAPHGGFGGASADIAGILFRRAVEFLKIRGNTDLVLLAGNLSGAPSDTEFLRAVRKVADNAPCPVAAIPGESDPAPEVFFEEFGKTEYIDIKGYRIVPFCAADNCGGEYVSHEDSLRLEHICRSFHGPKIICTCGGVSWDTAFGMKLFGESSAGSPRNILGELNIKAVIRGHASPECRPAREGFPEVVYSPVFCESPFSFKIVEFDGRGGCSDETVSLKLPDGVEWIDHHTHSPFAFCNENVDPSVEQQLMDALNIRAACVTEHSSHLCFQRSEYSLQKWFFDIPFKPSSQNRSAEYLHYFDGLDKSRFLCGTELDVNVRGDMVLCPELESGARFRIGAIHALSDPQSEHAPEEFLFLAESLLKRGGVKVLAHPYRVFAWNGVKQNPSHTYLPLVNLLRKYNAAAEVNFHHNRPDPVFTRMCIDAGVKISFGSDTHNLYEIGFFNPHIEFIRSIGCDGDLNDILL